GDAECRSGDRWCERLTGAVGGVGDRGGSGWVAHAKYFTVQSQRPQAGGRGFQGRRSRAKGQGRRRPSGHSEALYSDRSERLSGSASDGFTGSASVRPPGAPATAPPAAALCRAGYFPWMPGLKVSVITLGCDKNTVDSERYVAQLTDRGAEFTAEMEEA